MLQYILAILLIALISYYSLRRNNYWTSRNVPYAESTTWYGLTTNFLLKLKSSALMMQELYDQYPDKRYFGISGFRMNAFVIKDPDLIKQFAVKDFDNFVNHPPFIDADVDPLWSRNLFSLKNEQWRSMRATLSPSFTSSKMKMMFHLMSECGETFTNYFLNHPDETKYINTKDMFTRYTSDMIATTAFGIKCDSLTHRDNEFYLMGKEASNFTGFWKTIVFFVAMLSTKLSKCLDLKLFSTNVANFFTNLIQETIDTREEKNIKRPDVLQLLIESRKGKQQQQEESNGVMDTGFATVEEHIKPVVVQEKLTTVDITAQCLLFFVGGFESVSHLMNFMSYELTVNPDIQTKLIQEVDDTYAECNGKLTYEALMKMKYMDMVITETLRKYPTLMVIDRICTKPYTLQPKNPDESPVHFKVGDIVWFPSYNIHHDEKHYPNPTQFDPERFNDENKSKINPYTYLPFGVGPRNCIGSRFALLETKILFFHLLTKFELKVTDKTQVPLKFRKGDFNFIPERPITLALKPREK